jgi:NodT family efflux transporter outer membrane factor (OMF) lipoprotein
MRKAIDGNLDLAAADATIAQANETVAAAAGGLLPQVDFAAGGGRLRAAGVAGAATSNFYAVGPQASFDFDVFGGTKRLIEQRAALAEFQKHRFDAAYLTLTGDVASQALLLASARAQIDAVELLLADDRKNLELVSAGHLYGGATQVDVASAKSQLAQDQTLAPPLAQQRDVALHALSILAGKGPADWVAPDFDLTDFTQPPDLPVSLPSEVARDRPDILEAEAQLHAASAAIGVATADLYPRLQLSATLSAAAAGPGIGALWSVAAGLTGPIFHGGTLQANRRASVDGYKASLASYQQTVVRSLGQVADILRAINHDAEEYAAQERALSAAEASLRLNREAYRAGEIDVLQVLDAERAYQRALLGQIQARTAQYLDTVQLSVALGGNASGAFDRRTAFAAER